MRKLIAVVAVGTALVIGSAYTPVNAAPPGDKCNTVWNAQHTKVLYITCPTEEIDNTDG